jgi:cellobiose phosphorylase
MQWIFIDDKGSFCLKAPEMSSYLYFPLANEAGMMSSVTPTLNGDAKTGQNSFVLTPVSAEDLHNTKSGRNFWVYVEGKGAWSAVGSSLRQQEGMFGENKEETVLSAGILWHKLNRKSQELGLESEIISFVPTEKEQVELTKITITNRGKSEIRITPTAAVPLYARSADNLRDHRHVTSLLHRIYTTEDGVIVKPTLTFDERGHRPNRITYGVLGRDEDGKGPSGYFPLTEDFIDEGGNLEHPGAIVKNLKPNIMAGEYFEAYEAIGALRFEESVLKPNESKQYILAIAADESGSMFEKLSSKYLTTESFSKYLESSITYWDKKLNLSFQSADGNFDNWMRWVSFQPILRRIYGCSFLPHHDYGRGGRGWRDLWQDSLALLIMDPKGVKEMLYGNYGGVRIDGTNATIIGSGQGEFIADRNNITRVWMDHGAWPFLTTKLYIDQSGDLDFLLEEQTYFKDMQVCRGTKKDEYFTGQYGNYQLQKDDKLYKGTILEHLLVQHLTAFYDVGEHNNIRLNGADWNDGLDMAEKKGESVAFTALYCSNLIKLAELVDKLKEKKGNRSFRVARELGVFFEHCSYDSVTQKREFLENYLKDCKHHISGETIELDSDVLRDNLIQKADWLAKQIRQNEWISNHEQYNWFNGYYDDDGKQVEGDHENGVRMMLTSQVFTIMGGIATKEQIEAVIKSADLYLYDEMVGGYRLNTNFKEVKTNLGRLFGFGYGHKENGAVFSHMTIMYANALYTRGYAKEGFKVLNTLYKHCSDFEKSRIYPGIPEYINEKGRGMYHYLTGSASWLMLTVLTEMFGVKGHLGHLKIEPKLLKEQFNEQDMTTVKTVFTDKRMTILYSNPQALEYGTYKIKEILINDISIEVSLKGDAAVISKEMLQAYKDDEIMIQVILGK